MGTRGGGRHGGRTGDHGRGLLRQWNDHGGGISLRHASALGQGRQGANGNITESTQRREESGEQDMNPLIRFALDHPE